MTKTGEAVAADTKSKPKSGGGHPSKSLCSLLDYFVGVVLLVELKSGRSYEGTLTSASAYMDLQLDEATEFVPHKKRRVEDQKEEIQKKDTAAHLTAVHIRGSTIRYIHFPDDLDLSGVIRVGMDRERAALQKYSRGKRSKRSSTT